MSYSRRADVHTGCVGDLLFDLRGQYLPSELAASCLRAQEMC